MRRCWQWLGSNFKSTQAAGKIGCRQSKEAAQRPVRGEAIVVVHAVALGRGGSSEGGETLRTVLVVEPTTLAGELVIGVQTPRTQG